jgi:hypothetical protein
MVDSVKHEPYANIELTPVEAGQAITTRLSIASIERRGTSVNDNSATLQFVHAKA